MINQRKDAASINRAFLNWLADRREPDRPFFAFLNLLDAHDPYTLPQGAPYRFVTYSSTLDECRAVYELWRVLDKTKLPRSVITLARDSYDDCLRYIDEQLGILFDELQRRGVLEQTLIVVTSDHGEGLGEHGLFDHGESLYRTEIRVPLLIVPPSGLQSSVVVDETVSLRDLPATIVDLVGQGQWLALPGRLACEILGRFQVGGILDRPETMILSFRNSWPPTPRGRTKGDHRLLEGRSSHWPKGTSFTFAMKAMAVSNSSTSAMILKKLTTGVGSNRCGLSSRNSANRLDLIRRTSASSRR